MKREKRISGSYNTSRQVTNGTQENSSGPVFGIPKPWLMVAVAGLLMVLATASTFTFGVFFKPIATEFGWTRAEVSGSFALGGLVMALTIGPMGYWADRFGPRRVLFPCFLLLGVAFVATAIVTSLWQLYVAQGLIMGLGTAGPFSCLIATAGKWHDKRRGLAIGLTATGTGLSAVMFPPLATRLIMSIGWQEASILLGLVVAVGGICITFALKNPPIVPGQSAQQRQRKSLLFGWRALPHFLTDSLFLSIAVSVFLFGVAGNLVNSHLVNYATDVGVVAPAAATMMAVLGMSNTAGRLLIGLTSDRLGCNAAFSICLVMGAASLVLLGSSSSMPVTWASVIIFGFGYGGQPPMIVGLVAEHYGVKHLSSMSGMVLTVVMLANALGPWMGGIMFDVFNSYRLAFLICAAATSVALVIVLRLPPPSPNTVQLMILMLHTRHDCGLDWARMG